MKIQIRIPGTTGDRLPGVLEREFDFSGGKFSTGGLHKHLPPDPGQAQDEHPQAQAGGNRVERAVHPRGVLPGCAWLARGKHPEQKCGDEQVGRDVKIEIHHRMHKAGGEGAQRSYLQRERTAFPGTRHRGGKARDHAVPSPPSVPQMCEDETEDEQHAGNAVFGERLQPVVVGEDGIILDPRRAEHPAVINVGAAAGAEKRCELELLPRGIPKLETDVGGGKHRVGPCADGEAAFRDKGEAAAE